MASFSTVEQYTTHLRILVSDSKQVSDAPIKLRPTSRTKGVVYANALQFKDGGSLQFQEDIEIRSDGKIERSKYAFQYEQAGFYFRYERDLELAKPIVHEEYHLHVNDLRDIHGKEIRFKTHATDFEEIFKFVVACFCQPR